MRKRRLLSVPLSFLACLVCLLIGALALTGCGPKKEAAVVDDTLLMEVVQVDQHDSLGTKRADGQYLVARVVIKNNGLKSLVMKPAEFALQNITDKEEERYSQPAEKQMSTHMVKAYGKEFKDRVVDSAGINLYPNLQLERYFVFMVPSDADLDGYQIAYLPAKVSARLVSSVTLVNDHRQDAYFEE